MFGEKKNKTIDKLSETELTKLGSGKLTII